MAWITRMLSCALTGTVLLAAAFILTHFEPGYFNRGPWGREPPSRTVAREVRRMEKLEREQRESDAARRGRAEVLDAVIAGRCPLPEAAAAFWGLNRSMSHFNWANFRRAFPAATEGERCCRQVIGHVAGLLEDRPDRGAAVVRRLEAELQECLRRGPILLPGVDEGATQGQ
jgi:hypothetical protein